MATSPKANFPIATAPIANCAMETAPKDKYPDTATAPKLSNPERAIDPIEEIKPRGLQVVHTPTQEEIKAEFRAVRAKMAEKKKKRQDWEYINEAKKPLFNRIKL